MSRLLFSILLLAIFSCGKQPKTPKTNTDQETKQNSYPIIELKNADTIVIDSTLGGRLSGKKINTIFTRRVKNQFGIEYPIDQAYAYKDQSGEYYLLLTKHFKGIDEKNDSLYDKIYALNLSYKNNQLKKRSTLKGNIDNDWETSIEFWNKYSEISDLDKDGLADMILVYGTQGQDKYLDGKVRIVIYHNKKRVSIKHQNSILGDGRLTKFNSKFYNLPTQIQKAVTEKMRLMTANKHAIFAGDWEKEMANKATRLEEM